MADYTYSLRPTSTVYAAPEGVAFFPEGPRMPHPVTGAPPQWGDTSDETHADIVQDWIVAPDLTEGSTLPFLGRGQPTTDFAANPGLQNISALGFRFKLIAGGYAQVQWRFHDRSTGAVLADGPYIGDQPLYEPTTTTEDRVEVLNVTSGPVLDALRAGNLSLGWSFHAAAAEPVTVRMYESWFDITSTTPPPVVAVPSRLVTYNRAFQRGSDGFGITGGRRAFRATSQQASNRAIGFR